MWIFDEVDRRWEFVPHTASVQPLCMSGTWVTNRMGWLAFRPDVTLHDPT